MGILLSLGKFLVLLILSMVHSFNYANYIPFIILYLYTIKSINFTIYIYLSFSLVIYDITKYFFKLFSIKMMKLIGVHEYVSFSLGLLVIIQIGFSFVFYYHKSLIIFISYRIFLSLFNNLSSFITFPLSRLYNNKKFNYRLESFSFFQKFFNFLIFPIALIVLNDLNSFSFFCLFISVINIFCFITYLITFICNNNKEKQYYPQVSEKIKYKNNKYIINMIKEQNNKISQIITNKKEIHKLKSTKINTISEQFGDNTNLAIISGEIKNKFYLNNKNRKNGNNEITDNHEASINFCKNLSDFERNKTIKNNINDNSLKNRLYQKNNSNINNSEIINKIESSSDVVLGQFYGNNNKNRGKYEGSNNNNNNNSFQKQSSFQTSNYPKINLSNNNHKNIIKNASINNNLNKKKSKINIPNNSFIYLLIIHSIFKFIQYFSIFLLLIKIFEVKIILDENITYRFKSSFDKVMIIFSAYSFINMLFFIINKYLTSFIVKGSFFIKYCVFYPLHFIYLSSIIIFNHLFLNKKNIKIISIISIFSFQLIISESSMILLIYYNKIAVNKGFNQQILKETKSLGILIGSIIFILINTLRGIYLYVYSIKIIFFDNYFLYATILVFFVSFFIIGLIF